jgi:hypothetical protein
MSADRRQRDQEGEGDGEVFSIHRCALGMGKDVPAAIRGDAAAHRELRVT